MNSLTQDRLKEVLSYDELTGIFTWKKSSGTIQKGKIAGSLHERTGYKNISVFGKASPMHRLAWLYVYGILPSKMIDHINGDRSDNRIANLREATNSENQQNMCKPRMSNLYLGVTWHKSIKKWQAQLGINGKNKYLGCFETAELARDAYLKAKNMYHPFSSQANFKAAS